MRTITITQHEVGFMIQQIINKGGTIFGVVRTMNGTFTISFM